METNYRGIDYGMGTTNIDKENGIRYGVIPQHEVLQAWADSSEGYYGDATCPKCGYTANPQIDEDDILENIGEDNDENSNMQLPEWYDPRAEYHCPDCCYSFDFDEAYGDDPLCWTLDDGEYQAQCSGDDTDIFIIKSPYYTRAQFCSPCAPGACYLTNPCDEGERAYCFGHDWFEGGKAPYPVYRVADDSLVEE